MGIYLGNLSVGQIERRFGFTFTEDERTRLKETWHQVADFKSGESGWHMFDIPEFLVLSDDEVGHELFEIFMHHSGEMSGSFSGGWA